MPLTAAEMALPVLICPEELIARCSDFRFTSRQPFSTALLACLPNDGLTEELTLMVDPFCGSKGRCAIEYLALLDKGTDALSFCPAGGRDRDIRRWNNERETVVTNTSRLVVIVSVVGVGNGGVVFMLGGH